jgi:hypothetical protein
LKPSKSVFEFASALAEEIKWHGGHGQNGRSLVLKAGSLSMIYENGNLRYISNGKYEIIRMIYAAVRDKEWITVKPVITGEEFEVFKDSFKIEYSCHYVYGDINFMAHYTIVGNSDNSVTFSFDGEALNSFYKNRIGFCVLHPVEGCAGERCLITHSNNESETLMFPEFISPNQPFTDIKSMKWKIHGFDCTLDFSEDIFETEDQRNWTDASFKTYSTPLRIPYPVKLEKGTRIGQRIELKAEAEAEVEAEVEVEAELGQSPVIISVYHEKMMRLPAIGIGRSTRKTPLTDSEIAVLKELKFDQYRVDLYLFEENWKQKARTAIAESHKLKYPVEFALFFDEDAKNQLTRFIEIVSEENPEIDSVIIYDKSAKSTPDRLTDTIVPLLKNALPGIKVGSGTNANFAQLNRNRPASPLNDFICYSIHPQEHASDLATLTENLQAQEYTFMSAKQFANGKDIRISPVNIQRRFNANIENYEQPGQVAELPSQVDSRLMSLYGACWTAGSLKYQGEAGVTSITFYETAGERGIVQGDYPSRWPDEFKTFEGMIFPVFFVFRYILRYKSYKLVESESSEPLKVNSIVLYDNNDYKIILANFTSDDQLVDLGVNQDEIRIRQLNSETFADAVSNTDWFDNIQFDKVKSGNGLLLKPFSVSFIEGCFNL